MRDFLVPDLGEGLEDATITSWSVAVGDEVELNQTLCTVETNKAEVEIPSPYAGRIVELGGADGETLAVGAVLVRIATDAPAPDRQNGGEAGAQAGAGRLRHRRRRWTPAGGTGPTARDRAPSRRCASWPPTCTSTWLGSRRVPGPDGIVTREDVLAAAGTSGAGLRHRRRARCAGRRWRSE